MFVVPVNDHVLIEKVQQTKTKSGLILPERDDNAVHKGVVVGAATSVEQVDLGDLVIIDKYSGKTLEVEGKKYTLVKEKEILGRLEED